MRKKHKARIIAEKIMDILYFLGFVIFFLSASGMENATTANYICFAIAFAFMGTAIFIDNF